MHHHLATIRFASSRNPRMTPVAKPAPQLEAKRLGTGEQDGIRPNQQYRQQKFLVQNQIPADSLIGHIEEPHSLPACGDHPAVVTIIPYADDKHRHMLCSPQPCGQGYQQADFTQPFSHPEILPLDAAVVAAGPRTALRKAEATLPAGRGGDRKSVV